jgi:2-polyprenyl-6-methoxyphenol hydroxylase-like FAD-dependent oxidoreductase
MRTILVSGAGIAGTALAYWLGRYGFATTVVEAAPALRTGGFPVDFRGAAHLAVLERMGILDEVRDRRAPATTQLVVDEAGTPVTRMPPEVTAGEIEIRRGDLVDILYERSRSSVDYRFDDSIAALIAVDGGVDVTFERSGRHTYDLVVGADGLHSTVRRLVFGPEPDFLRFLGYYAASFAIPNYLALADTRLFYNCPGKLAVVGACGGRADATFMFASAPLEIDHRDTTRQRAAVADAFAGIGWETPRLIDAMWTTPDFYFVPTSRIEMDRYVDGRVVLLGDAGYAAFGGMGTGLAVVGAYVLAGELVSTPHDHREALARYQNRMRDYVAKCQHGGSRAGQLFVPATWEEIRRRNNAYRLMRESKRLRDVFVERTRTAAGGIELPDYPVRRGG